MFERYTEGARRVIFFARFEASQYGTPAIEPEHMLLALFREYRSLLEGQLSHDSATNLRTVIEAQLKKGQRFPTSVEVPLSSESQNILRHAYEEARRLSHDYIGPEHILFGIIAEEKCTASRFLREHGMKIFEPREEHPRRPTSESIAKRIPAKNLDWCCEGFQVHLFHVDRRPHGLGIFILFHSRIPPMFILEYRRPDWKEPEPIAEDRIKLKFCPWCGRNLIDQYGSGLPPIRSANLE